MMHEGKIGECATSGRMEAENEKHVLLAE